MTHDPTVIVPPPVIDAGFGGPLAVAAARPDLARALLASARRTVGRVGLRVGDSLARRWLTGAGNPYDSEMAAIAGLLGEPGVFALNVSHEFACTTGVGPDPEGTGNRMLRVLDWRQAGLGRALVVARFESIAGVYVSATWPGYVGVITAMAPGRFSAAFNQAPLPRPGPTLVGDWIRQKLSVWRSTALPPAHLLRLAFETCATYRDACALLADSPVCLPALFVVSGVTPAEGCVIERLPDRAVVHQSPAAVANHWLTPGATGRPRGTESHGRQAALYAFLQKTIALETFGWLQPPILNPTTRVVAEARAAEGTMIVQGWEASGQATKLCRWP